MILETVINLFVSLIKMILGLFQLPQVPSQVTAMVDQLFKTVGGGLSLVYFFVGKEFILLIVPLAIAVENAHRIYSFAMFIVRKLPFSIE